MPVIFPIPFFSISTVTLVKNPLNALTDASIYLYNEINPVLHGKVSTRKPFRGILIYPSGKLTHPPHTSLADGGYNRWITPTVTEPTVPATTPSMIVARKHSLSCCQYACRFHLRFRQQPASKFSLNFIFLMHLRIYLMKLVFDSWQGGEFAIVESFRIKFFFISNQMVFRFESRIVSNYVLNRT